MPFTVPRSFESETAEASWYVAKLKTSGIQKIVHEDRLRDLRRKSFMTLLHDMDHLNTSSVQADAGNAMVIALNYQYPTATEDFTGLIVPAAPRRRLSGIFRSGQSSSASGQSSEFGDPPNYLRCRAVSSCRVQNWRQKDIELKKFETLMSAFAGSRDYIASAEASDEEVRWLQESKTELARTLNDAFYSVWDPRYATTQASGTLMHPQAVALIFEDVLAEAQCESIIAQDMISGIRKEFSSKWMAIKNQLRVTDVDLDDVKAIHANRVGTDEWQALGA